MTTPRMGANTGQTARAWTFMPERGHSCQRTRQTAIQHACSREAQTPLTGEHIRNGIRSIFQPSVTCLDGRSNTPTTWRRYLNIRPLPPASSAGQMPGRENCSPPAGTPAFFHHSNLAQAISKASRTQIRTLPAARIFTTTDPLLSCLVCSLSVRLGR